MCMGRWSSDQLHAEAAMVAAVLDRMVVMSVLIVLISCSD